MKKLLALFLATMMLLSLSACGGGNKKDVVGTWHIVDETTQTEYGLGIQFEKDGTLRYGLTEEMFGEDVSEEDLAAPDFLMKMEYKIKSDTEMEVTMKALMGLAKEKALMALFGKCMKELKGNCDPQTLRTILIDAVNKA